MREKLGKYIKEYSVRNKANEDIPVYSVTNTQGFCQDYFGKEVASKDKSTYKIVPRGCFAYNPSRINVGSIDWQRNEDRVIVSPLYNVFSTSELLDQQYLYYFLKSDIALQMIRSAATGSVRDNLKFSMLCEFSTNIPALEMQKGIVRILDKVKTLIDFRQQELQKLDDLVKARFVEMFENISYPTERFSRFIESLTSGSRGWAKYCVDDGSEWFITIKNVKNCCISTNNMQPINAPRNAEAIRTKVKEGDLLISITADLGRTGVVSKEIAEHGAYINQHLTCIRVDRKIINPLFIAYYLDSPAGKMQFEAKNQSAVKAGLNFEAINSLMIKVPPIELQNEFETFVQQIDKSKFVVQQALDKAQLLFDSLMQQYFG